VEGEQRRGREAGQDGQGDLATVDGGDREAQRLARLEGDAVDAHGRGARLRPGQAGDRGGAEIAGALAGAAAEQHEVAAVPVKG
jgi:hypothetical protein